MKLRGRRTTKKARIEIITMIDIMFFLLVFYMVTSQAIAQQQGLGVELPQVAQAGEAASAEVTLSVDESGHLSVDQKPVTLETEAAAIVSAMAKNPQGLLVVRADKRAFHGVVVSAMDQARQAGVRRFAIATELEPGAAAAH
ncbi:MAG: ExbD/TolR family protein [Deltaproteobacteria bacterium]